MRGGKYSGVLVVGGRYVVVERVVRGLYVVVGGLYVVVGGLYEVVEGLYVVVGRKVVV